MKRQQKKKPELVASDLDMPEAQTRWMIINVSGLCSKHNPAYSVNACSHARKFFKLAHNSVDKYPIHKRSHLKTLVSDILLWNSYIMQFDELQTIEHTKCKPLSVAIAVDEASRRMLGITVASMPATGYMAEMSRQKYGYRADRRRAGLKQLSESIKES
ncbi:MAG: hypothetical protein GY730_02805, partial [bacterium]|nr:hypothetical protein [bacterium]